MDYNERDSEREWATVWEGVCLWKKKENIHSKTDWCLRARNSGSGFQPTFYIKVIQALFPDG